MTTEIVLTLTARPAVISKLITKRLQPGHPSCHSTIKELCDSGLASLASWSQKVGIIINNERMLRDPSLAIHNLKKTIDELTYHRPYLGEQSLANMDLEELRNFADCLDALANATHPIPDPVDERAFLLIDALLDAANEDEYAAVLDGDDPATLERLREMVEYFVDTEKQSLPN